MARDKLYFNQLYRNFAWAYFTAFGLALFILVCGFFMDAKKGSTFHIGAEFFGSIGVILLGLSFFIRLYTDENKIGRNNNYDRTADPKSFWFWHIILGIGMLAIGSKFLFKLATSL